MAHTLTSARVAVVSGKGGVGKTTVAAALALAAARAGKRTLLAEIEDRDAIAPLFGRRSLGYEETTLAPNLSGLSIVPDDALAEYLAMFYGIKRIGRALAHSKVTEFATNTAPGLRDILLIGKVMQSERSRTGGGYTYDLVVLDAPPTGRLPRLLDAPRAISELVRAGPIRQQAQTVLSLVLDPKRLQVVLVTLPEDMPVTETAEAAEALEKMGVALGPVVVNAIAPPAPSLGRSLRRTLAAAAERAGIALGDDAIAQLAAVAADASKRARVQAGAIAELGRTVLQPRVDLPLLPSPAVGRDEIEQLASVLLDAGAVS